MADDRGTQPAQSAQEQEPADLQAPEQAAMEAAHQDGMEVCTPGGTTELPATQEEIQRIQQRANKKAELAAAQSANTQMVVDPAEVDDLAKFFEDEAEALASRSGDVQNLGSVPAPGADPVSERSAEIHGQVGTGDDQAYSINYMKLAKVFRDTAASLRSSAKQTRTSDADSAADIEQAGANLA